MEVIAGLPRIKLTSCIVGLLIIFQCSFLFCEEIEEVQLSEEDQLRAIDIMRQVIREGGDPIGLLQDELERLQNLKPLSRETLERLLKPAGGLYVPLRSVSNQNESVLDMGDHEAKVRAAAGATASEPSGDQDSLGIDYYDDDGEEDDDDGEDDDDDDEYNENEYDVQERRKAGYIDQNDHHQTDGTTARASGDSVPEGGNKNSTTEPETGNQTQGTTIESSSVFAGEPKVVSSIVSTTSADGTRKKISSSTHSSYSSATPPADANSLYLDTLGSETVHDLDPDDSEHQLGEQLAHYDHDQHFDAPIVATDNYNTHANLPHPNGPTADAYATAVAHSAHDEHYQLNDRDHIEHQPEAPNDEHYEETYIDNSDPSNPKEVHVEKKVKSVVGPGGTSHTHHESRTSTSLRNKSNSFHRSRSSYSTSSMSSSEFGSKSNLKQKNRPSKKHRRQQSHMNNKNTQRNFRNPHHAHRITLPPMPVPPVAIMHYGMPGWSPMFVGSQSPYAWQYPYGGGHVGHAGFRKRHQKGPHMSKRQKKRMLKAEKRRQASLVGPGAMATGH